MVDVYRRQRRLEELRKRLANPEDAYERCRAFPCPNRTTADRGEGLNRLYCRKHVEHYRRHGSYVKSSYGAAELRPYRKRAANWLLENSGHPPVMRALAAIQGIYRSAGAPVEAFRLAGKSPADRAKAIWAKLRERGVDPIQVVAAWVAVGLCLADDPQPDRHDEYRLVQAAKVLHRLAGGTHKRWERERLDGSIEATVLHKHPSSRGLVLRNLGRHLEGACGVLDLNSIAGL